MNKIKVVYECEECKKETKAEFLEIIEPPKRIDCPRCPTGRAGIKETHF